MFFRATDVAIDHLWDHGRVTREPTAERPGLRTYTCTRCGAVWTEEIPYKDDSKGRVVTGDERELGLWLFLLAASAAAMLGTVAVRRRRG